MLFLTKESRLYDTDKTTDISAIPDSEIKCKNTVVSKRIADAINYTIEPNRSYIFLDNIIYDCHSSKCPEILISEDIFDDIFKIMEENNFTRNY